MWLLKTEPGDYSWAELEKAGRARWDGVRNPAAIRNLAAMKAGDRVFVYHTGDEKAVVGVAEVVKPAYPDPKFPEGKLMVVDIEARGKLGRPVTLAEIKAKASMKDFPLVRISRLSVMPVSDREWREIEKMSGG